MDRVTGQRDVGFQSGVIRTGGVATVMLGFAIPLSTTLSGVLIATIIGCWLLSARWKAFPWSTPAAKISLAWLSLLLFLALSALYSKGSIEEIAQGFQKYHELLLPLLLIPFLYQQPLLRQKVHYAVLAALLLTLLSSLADFSGIIDVGGRFEHSIKSPITHSLLMAVLAYWSLIKAFDSNTPRYGWLVVTLFSLVNIFAVVEGRTGYFVSLVLGLLFITQRFGLKRILVIAPLGVILFTVALYSVPRLHERITEMGEGVLAFSEYGTLYTAEMAKKSVDEHDFNSMTVRLEYLARSLKLAASAPLFGSGVGAFKAGYRELAEPGSQLSSNPHNEFLMITIQLGITGLVLLALVLWITYSEVRGRQDFPSRLQSGLLAAFVVNSMLNSTLLDHTEGYLFLFMWAVWLAGLEGGSGQEDAV